MISNVADELARGVADGLGMALPKPLPKALDIDVKPEVTQSAALSLFALPGDGSIRTRHIALLIADGVSGDVQAMHEELAEQGAVPRYVGARLGQVETDGGAVIEVEVTLETTPSVLYDAVIVPAGGAAAATLAGLGQALEFLKDQYRHCKPMLAIGEGSEVLRKAGIPDKLPNGKPDPGLLRFPDGAGTDVMASFIQAVAKHRHFERAMDPPAL
jgi:catalase